MVDASPLWVSLRAVSLSTVVVFFLGLLLARATMDMKGRKAFLIDMICTLPMVLPPTVTGFFLLVVFGRNSLFGRLLKNIGVSMIFSWQATVLAVSVVSFPLMYRGAKGALKQVPKEHVWVARTLGMKEGRILWRIMMPEAWPGVGAGLALAFARALGEFGATMMIAGNIPGKTQTIPMAIYFATAGGDMRSAWIWVGIITVLSCVALACMEYAGRKNE